tara:strand:+ start:417 stop:773 length:357 start_codon:yes stop_codon:yes gene_type:complete
MAEGFAQIKLSNSYSIYSAGVEAHGLNPKSVKVMSEVGIDISSQTSKSITDDEIFQYDLVVTLCGDAMDRCPSLLSNDRKHIHWDLRDPARAKGTDEEVLDVYRFVRDQINKKIDSLK